MTAKVMPAAKRLKEPSLHLYRPPPATSTPDEERAFWKWATTPSLAGAPPGMHAQDLLLIEEQRVLSKAASGGGFLVPTDIGEMITAAARAASMIAQVALELVTETGETVGMALPGTHGSAAWTAESASYTPSDETITQANLGSYKSTSKIIVSEELRRDAAVELDDYLAFELGGRLGPLQETALTVGDGSGKPLGIVHASSPYTVVNAATGSSTSYKLADLVTIYKALPAAYRANATWLVNADDFGSLAGLTDSAGGLVLPSLQFDSPSMFGRPVLVSADLPAPAASAKSLAFGDRKRAYAVRRMKEVSLVRQDEIHSDSGQIGFEPSPVWTAGRFSRTRRGSSPTVPPRAAARANGKVCSRLPTSRAVELGCGDKRAGRL
jgi:HK97 family phage major capsid protein